MILKILSLNLQEYEEWDERFLKICELLKKSDPDIIVFQEGILDKNISDISTVEQINKQIRYHYMTFCPCFDYSLDYGKGILQNNSVIGGLGILSKFAFDWGIQDLPIIQGIDRWPRKAIICDFGDLSLANIHLSNKGIESRNLEWEALEKTDIIIGDFNTFPDELEARILGTDYSSSYNHTPYISYPGKNETLDYCITKKGKILSVEAIDEWVSDHAAMMYVIEF